MSSARQLLPRRITPPARGDLLAAITVGAGPGAAVAGLREAGRPPRRHRAVHRRRRHDRRWTDRLVALPADRSGRTHQPAHPRCATSLAAVGSAEYVALAALLALVVGVVRLLIGVFRWGFVAYLMSQPVVSAFTAAAALLIVCSQIPGTARGAHRRDEPGARGPRGRQRPECLEPDRDRDRRRDGGAGPRRPADQPPVPGAFVGAAAALLLTTYGVVTVAEVGHVPNGLPTPSFALPWSQTPSLLLLRGRHRAGRLRGGGQHRAQVRLRGPGDLGPRPRVRRSGPGQRGLRVLQGYPAGGSFSRSP